MQKNGSCTVALGVIRSTTFAPLILAGELSVSHEKDTNKGLNDVPRGQR